MSQLGQLHLQIVCGQIVGGQITCSQIVRRQIARSQNVQSDITETLAAVVPRSVRISEAPSYGQTVHAYDGASIGALAYLEAAAEIAERGAPTPPSEGA